MGSEREIGSGRRGSLGWRWGEREDCPIMVAVFMYAVNKRRKKANPQLSHVIIIIVNIPLGLTTCKCLSKHFLDIILNPQNNYVLRADFIRFTWTL